MKQENLTEKALELVKEYQNDKDKAGNREFKHPIRVMNNLPKGTPEEVKQAALLHDIVEDTSLDLKDLKRAGFSSLTIKIVDALTKGKEFKPDYIEKQTANFLMKTGERQNFIAGGSSAKIFNELVEKRSYRNERYVDSLMDRKNRDVALYSSLVKFLDYDDNSSKKRLSRHDSMNQDLKLEGMSSAFSNLRDFLKENKSEFKDRGIKKFGSWLRTFEMKNSAILDFSNSKQI